MPAMTAQWLNDNAERYIPNPDIRKLNQSWYFLPVTMDRPDPGMTVAGTTIQVTKPLQTCRVSVDTEDFKAELVWDLRAWPTASRRLRRSSSRRCPQLSEWPASSRCW